MNTVRVSIVELEGAALDWAVARATKAWEWAHRLFPTMTLDSTFKDAIACSYPRGEFGSSLPTCVLVPNNSMRQDPRPFCPSTEWEHGGPLIAELGIHLVPAGLCGWDAALEINKHQAKWNRQWEWIGGDNETPLIAACRALVLNKIGDEIEIPKELMP
ncbi:phage protein NinX family protein [Pseudomonas aeruginosa]|uniref:phage protein NinX family protein n=1 Tax=Pseudomonas aeruginosa TaxID=287 RepID=UPI0008FBB74A|nr:DUF2591 family protein [Pseudomonas aeruginosa]EKJ8513837.1 DUF2591 domain-containing protein [Pseudomonas aeruginosa]EKU5852390.1 DUF2591 family protein [Pseudomonas aeruginosa]ELK7310579.1 DUF2591 family protein [Pseudomonas aeruginosa]ELP0277594.1 DUF2591 family protein [Pseudomonas aeruginosa]